MGAREGRRGVSHPTPRTDAEAFELQFVSGEVARLKRLADHARRLEQELVELRLALADSCDHSARHAEKFLHDDPRFGDDADRWKARAAHLRDLKTPMDPSKL